MKKIVASTILVFMISSVFCQIRTSLGVSAVIPISNSAEYFDTGISSDFSVTYNFCQYVHISGVFEYTVINVKNTDHYAKGLNFIIGVGLDYPITPALIIRITPNIGFSDFEFAFLSTNGLRFGSDLSLGYKFTEHVEIEPTIGIYSISNLPPYSDELLDAMKIGLKIGYNF